LENHENGGRKPVLMVVVGRQRVGKTSFLNALAQYLQERGAEFAIWDTDQMNTTNNMSVFHAQTSSPSSERREDVKAWLEERFLDIAERRYDALLDVGGGDTPLTQLVEDVPVAAALAELGVRVVVVHVLGPDVADLDYLDRFERNLFTPEAVLIVRNSGLILNGRSDDIAFATLHGHAGLQRALDKGAVLVSLPRLACMSEVTDRGLSFAEAMNGKFGADGKGLSIFDRLRVRKWWTDELPRVFSEIPAEWLPEMRAQATGTGG
jgi:Zeta toxin